jgi:predicted ATPase
VGRRDELGLLRAAYGAAAAGDGCCVLIEGEPGVGKSRLVEQLFAELRKAGTTARTLKAAYPPGGAGVGSQVYAELLQAARESTSPGSGAEQRAGDADALAGALARVAGAGPVVLWVDDAQFASDEGRRQLRTVVASAASERALVVVTTHPGLPAVWTEQVARVVAVRRLRLAPLARSEIDALVDETVGADVLPVAVRESLVKHCGGSPFCVLEVLSDLRRRGVLRDNGDGTFALGEVPSQVGVPESLQRMVSNRLARLDEDDRMFLDVAACAGEDFDAVRVAAAVGRATESAEECPKRIQLQHGLIWRDGGRWRFEPPLVREVLVESLTEFYREGYRAAFDETPA